MISAEEFLEQAVRIRSVSGEEASMANFAAQHMRDCGFSDVRKDAVGNVIGKWGVGGKKTVYLVGHIDTVAGEIPVRTENGVLFGRGAVDAKGPFCTFVRAVAELPRELPARLVVVGAVEEEAATSKGARQILRDLPEPDAVIIGEPSHTHGVTLGYKGRLRVNLEVKRSVTL